MRTPELTLLNAVGPLGDAAARRAARLFAGVRNRRTMQHLTGFSDHRLQDIGFERDWDGSIIRRRR